MSMVCHHHSASASRKRKKATDAQLKAFFEWQERWKRRTAGELRKAGEAEKARKLRNCGADWWHAPIRACSQDASHYAKPVPFTCQQRFCPACNWSRAMQIANDCTDLALATATAPEASCNLKLITLTTPFHLYDADAKATLTFALKAARAAMDRTLFAVYKAQLPAEERREGRLNWKNHPEVGYVMGAEYGSDLHLHFHAFCCSPDLPYELLQQNWSRKTKGQAYGINIERVAVNYQSIRDTIRYAVKLTTLAPEDVPRLHDTLYKVRLVRRVGMFGGTKGLGKKKGYLCPTCGSPLVLSSSLAWRAVKAESLYLIHCE